MSGLEKEIVKGSNVYISERAFVCGDVELKDNVNIWAGASVRGDDNRITVGKNSNIQDNVTVHCEKYPVIIGENVTIGHNAVVHGAEIADNVMIGMGSIVLDGTKVGKNTIIGAGAVVPGGRVIPENSVVVGNPYKILRNTTPEETAHITANAEHYVKLAAEYLKHGK